MTFSIVGRSADGTQLGCAVASKFLGVGAYVLGATVAGAVATQAYGHVGLRERGPAMLAGGLSAAELLDQFFSDDPKRAARQAGAVDAAGRTATYTGAECLAWGGGITGEGPEGSFAIQGNMLTGPEVLDAMVDSWRASTAAALGRRLVDALQAGQEAGGDPRGKQAAAVLVVSPSGGYGGETDVVLDYRADNSPEPITDLYAMLAEHELLFGKTPEAELLTWTAELTDEVRSRLVSLGHADGELQRDLWHWMGVENYEERWYDDGLDPVVLEQLRVRT